jgi:serine/threonine protein kinase
MDAANRNLAQIYLQERPGLDTLRDMARQIFEAVQHLHSRKLMHGDLKVRAPHPPMLPQPHHTAHHHMRTRY